MQMPPVISNKNDGLVFYILLLTGFFFLLEISFFIQCNQMYLADFSYVNDKLPIPIKVLPALLWFVLVQIGLHLIYAVVIVLVTKHIANFFKISAANKIYLAISLWFFGVFSILLANQHLYPNSKFSTLTALIFYSPAFVSSMLTVCMFVAFIILFIVCLDFLKRYTTFKLLTLSVIIVGLVAEPFYRPTVQDGSSASTPNIILIGVDSLRPDFISYLGSSTRTPFLDAFLKDALFFPEALTPAARTFPSWMSVLTGLYPKQMGIRFDLALHTEPLVNSLPNVLKRFGYQTVYATDETRFSNMKKDDGFEYIIGPKMGLNDFLIGTFNDFPISNLIVNSALGEKLFPYSYANRAAFFLYNPNQFISLLSNELPRSRTKPLFLAVHFCLPHFPYVWSSLAGENLSLRARYQASVVAVDQQLRDFFTLLNEEKLLSHAMVVIFSDHGEALEFEGDRITERSNYEPGGQPFKFYPPSLDEEDFNQSAGHGTDVLGLSQYHALLAFRLYGTSQSYGEWGGVASLMDIYPTVLSILNIPLPYRTAGRNLHPYIREDSHPQPLKSQHFFIESDFSPAAIRSVYPNVHEAMLAGVGLFSISSKTLQLSMQPEVGKMIIKSKQFADIYGDWVLALYPQTNDRRTPILVNLVTGRWTDQLDSAFAQRSPAKQMLDALLQFYAPELDNIEFTHAN